MSTKEEKDIVEIKAEIEKIRHHLDLFKKAQSDTASSLVRIENALIGNPMNGNQGLVSEFKAIETEVKKQSEKLIEYRVYFAILGVIASVSFSGMVALCVKLFTS